VQIVKAVLLNHHFPILCKYAPLISILKPWKDPSTPSFYRAISLSDKNVKLFEKILLDRILHEERKRGLTLVEQFGFRTRHRTSLLFAGLFQRISGNFREDSNRTVFLGMAKVFDTVWIDSLLYKLTLLNFPSYIVHTITSYNRGRSFEASLQRATSSRRGMRAGVAQGGLNYPVLFSLRSLRC
jgi:hypothetical protein